MTGEVVNKLKKAGYNVQQLTRAKIRVRLTGGCVIDLTPATRKWELFGSNLSGKYTDPIWLLESIPPRSLPNEKIPDEEIPF